MQMIKQRGGGQEKYVQQVLAISQVLFPSALIGNPAPSHLAGKGTGFPLKTSGNDKYYATPHSRRQSRLIEK
jgi:hypothetical protein